MERSELELLNASLIECRRCPRLVEWREKVASERVARFASDDYWGRPVPGFGDEAAELLIVGLAPAAHGANRTGRMFTGDRSGDWLFTALHAVGLANQSSARHADDGLELAGVYITSIVHCAPPANRPTPDERGACQSWLAAEIAAIDPAVILCLGGMSFDQVIRLLRARGAPVPVPKPSFTHGAEVDLGSGWPSIVASYHPSQHNTFTGRLTQAMLQQTLARAAALSSQ